MFTGYIHHTGKILQIDALPHGKRFLIACNYTDLEQGESIAVNGACLTAVNCTPHQFYCDVSPETLAITTADHLKPGDAVNLERSLRANDRLHGHFVMGHVDQVCVVAAKKRFTDYTEYTFDHFAIENKPFLVQKGSIAVNGVSLTLNIITNDSFTVMLIPETLRNTNLSALEVGDSVNIEYDYLAKIVTKPRNINHE
jgi:riboflavin synthase